MLFIAYQSPNQKQIMRASPLIIPIQPFLNQNVSELVKLCHSHFKKFVSPFIQKENLKLISKNSQTLNYSFPLYMYINTSDYLQEMICTIKGFEQQDPLNKWRYIRNSLIIKTQAQVKIIPKQQLARVNNFLYGEKGKQSDLIINGKIIEVTQQQQLQQKESVLFSKILQQSWEKLARQNQCIYLKSQPAMVRQ